MTPFSLRATGRLAAAALTLLGSLACCVAPPSSEEWTDVGFRSPEQTFRTFQTASAGDSPELEFACLSTGFRSQNGLSMLGWLEFREDLYRREPLLRYAVDRAEITEISEADEERCELLARALGTTLRVRLVREAFYEIWTDEGLLHSADADFSRSVLGSQSTDGAPILVGFVPLPAGLAAGTVTELSLRREWKIDGFEVERGD